MKTVNISIAGATSIESRNIYWAGILEYKGHIKMLEGSGSSGSITIELARGIVECVGALKEKCNVNIVTMDYSLYNFIYLLKKGEISKDFIKDIKNARVWENLINCYDTSNFDIFHVKNGLLYKYKNLEACIKKSNEYIRE